MKELNEHQREAIESYKNLQKTINIISENKNIEEIIEWIRIQNGWTTLAEFKFNQATIDILNNQLLVINKGIKELTISAKSITQSK